MYSYIRVYNSQGKHVPIYVLTVIKLVNIFMVTIKFISIQQPTIGNSETISNMV
jgi:hypothetical protein